ASWQQILVDRDRCGRGPAASFHLRTTVRNSLRDGGAAALDLAVVVRRRPCILPCRGSREADHSNGPSRAQRSRSGRINGVRYSPPLRNGMLARANALVLAPVEYRLGDM